MAIEQTGKRIDRHMTVGGRIGRMWLVVLFVIAYEMLRVCRGCIYIL